MKKLASFLAFLLIAVAAFGQSNSVTVSVIAPPSWTITVTPKKIYAGRPATLTITVTAGPVSSVCVGNWDAANLPLVFPNPIPPTNPVVLTANLTAAMVTLGDHTVFITCPEPVLSMNSPVTLPNAKQGVAYSANLSALASLSGGMPPYNWTLSGGALPAGLSLSFAGVVSGTSSGAGSFSFQFKVTDSSGVATNQLLLDTFGRLEVAHPVTLSWEVAASDPAFSDPLGFKVYRRKSPADPTKRSILNSSGM